MCYTTINYETSLVFTMKTILLSNNIFSTLLFLGSNIVFGVVCALLF